MQQGSGLAIRGDTRAVRGILLDLEGVVYVRDRLLPPGGGDSSQVYHQHDAPPTPGRAGVNNRGCDVGWLSVSSLECGFLADRTS